VAAVGRNRDLNEQQQKQGMRRFFAFTRPLNRKNRKRRHKTAQAVAGQQQQQDGEHQEQQQDGEHQEQQQEGPPEVLPEVLPEGPQDQGEELGVFDYLNEAELNPDFIAADMAEFDIGFFEELYRGEQLIDNIPVNIANENLVHEVLLGAEYAGEEEGQQDVERAEVVDIEVVNISDSDEDMDANQGFDQGFDQGLDQGLDQGAEQGAEQGADQGADQGAEQGADQGFDMGFDQGADQGADMGFDQGADMGFDQGADMGVDMGADQGADMEVQGGQGADMEVQGGDMEVQGFDQGGQVEVQAIAQGAAAILPMFPVRTERDILGFEREFFVRAGGIPEFEGYEARLDSMPNCYGKRLNVDRAEGGFYYLLREIICFYCNLRLRARKSVFDLTSIHCKYSSQCPRLLFLYPPQVIRTLGTQAFVGDTDVDVIAPVDRLYNNFAL